MELLQGLHAQDSVLLDRLDGLHRRLCGGHGGHVGNLALDSGLADVAVVGGALLADRGVHDESDLLVGDGVEHVGTALVDLGDLGGRNAGVYDLLVGSSGGNDAPIPRQAFIRPFQLSRVNGTSKSHSI